ncbi:MULTISPECIES: CidA/LrgA family protein [Proteiniclasticum]|jgi:holin-like protein|uniref:CidA/LrgA family protein n=1 Tax=Proteiniclasticum TaxID=1155385 RepID=UPI000E897E89|nr:MULTISPECIES: CidA/LrgA family protein [Proteiniclasticum]HBW13624.1 CidA/LrgA family protein [Proteiniclasticum sp.]
MKLLRQLAWVLLILLLGEAVRVFSGISIPGTVIGMILLFLLLLSGLLKLEQIADISKFLLDHLAFLFVPAGVGLMSNFQVIKEAWLPILAIILISTVLVMGVTGWTIQLMKRRVKS